MPKLSIAETEQIKEDASAQNKALFEYIRKHNSSKELKNMQIIRFAEDLLIAIHRPKDPRNLPRGFVGTVYDAYPIKTNGAIERNKRKLKLKIVNDSATFIYMNQIKDYERTKLETHNNNQAFSSRMTIIPCTQKENGETVYEAAILMSEVFGERLDLLIRQQKFKKGKVSRVKRIFLAIDIINFFIDLHSRGTYAGDIKAENFFVDLKTQQGIAIDIDPQHSTSRIEAPEAEVTAASDTYCIAQDILTPIFSGVRPIRNGKGEIVNKELIEEGIIKNLDTVKSPSPLPYTIFDLLNDMQNPDPRERKTLPETKAELLRILQKEIPQREIKSPSKKTLRKIEKNIAQIHLLETLLKDPQYSIPPRYRIPKDVAIGQYTFFAKGATSSDEKLPPVKQYSKTH